MKFYDIHLCHTKPEAIFHFCAAHFNLTLLSLHVQPYHPQPPHPLATCLPPFKATLLIPNPRTFRRQKTILPPNLIPPLF